MVYFMIGTIFITIKTKALFQLKVRYSNAIFTQRRFLHDVFDPGIFLA